MTFPVSKMRRRWEIQRLKPKEVCLELFARISKNKEIFWPECGELLKKICKRYSFTPERTLSAIVPERFHNEKLTIRNGYILNVDDVMDELWKKEFKLKESLVCDFVFMNNHYSVCNFCAKAKIAKDEFKLVFKINCYVNVCKTCFQINKYLDNKESDIREIKSLIRKVQKECRNQSKPQAI